MEGLGRRPEWKGEEGEYCQLTSPLQTNNVWCSKEMENAKLTVLLPVVGGGSSLFFAKLLLTVTPQQRQLDSLTLPNVQSCFLNKFQMDCLTE